MALKEIELEAFYNHPDVWARLLASVFETHPDVLYATEQADALFGQFVARLLAAQQMLDRRNPEVDVHAGV